MSRLAFPSMTKAMYLFVAIALAGCATMRSVDTRNVSNIRETLEAGDRMTLVTQDYRRYELRVVSLSEVEIEGEDADGLSVVNPYEEIRLLEVREARPGRTAGAVAGGIVGGAVVLYILVVVVAVFVVTGVSGL